MISIAGHVNRSLSSVHFVNVYPPQAYCFVDQIISQLNEYKTALSDDCILYCQPIHCVCR